MNKKPDIKIYRLKIVFDKESKELLHLSESIDNEGSITFNVNGDNLVVPEEMTEILNTLDDDTLGIT